MVVWITLRSKLEALFDCIALSSPHSRTGLLITLSLYHCRDKSQALFSENISAKDIDNYPKEAYNKGIGSEKIR
nr:MAG TPA: hypothetical protein [Bacteriophage sp.]